MTSMIALAGLALTTGPARGGSLPADKLSSIFGKGKIEGIYSEDVGKNYELINQLVALGLADHPALTAEAERRESAKSALLGAQAAYQPTAVISASAGRSRTSESTDDTTVTGDSIQAGATLRQNIWRGGADSAAVRAAEADETLAELQLESQRATTAYDISRAAVSFHAAAVQKKIAEAAADDARQILALSERKHKAGQSGKLEVYRASMRSSEAQANVARAEVQLNQALHALLRNMSLEKTTPVEGLLQKLAASPIPLPKSPPAEAPTETTFSERMAASTADKTDALLTKSKRSRYFPEIDLIAGFSRTLSETETSVNAPVAGNSSDADKTNRTSVSLELNWPLWARTRDHQISQAWHEKNAADAKAAKARLNATYSRRETHTRLVALYQSLPALREAFNQADALYQAQRTLYDTGSVDVFAVNDADSLRVTALKNWYDAIVEIHQAYIKLAALKSGIAVPSVSGG
jgi:outer membrane protein TolC